MISQKDMLGIICTEAIEPVEGFIYAPAVADIKPTERELALLNMLAAWQEESIHSLIELGKPCP